jgi:hypothetical protein
METHALNLLDAIRTRASENPPTSEIQHPLAEAIDIKHVDWWSRCIPLSHGVHSTGFSRTWPGQPLLPVESRLEHAILTALTKCATCVALATQPVTVHYLAGDQPRSYTPDILVAYVCPESKRLECFLIEVKTRSDFERHRFKLEERQRAVLEATALPLVIVTDEDLCDWTEGEAA